MKVVLVSDSTLNADGGGICQTLYNIFLFIKPADILCITSNQIYRKIPPSKPFGSCYITYQFEVISLVKNRYAKYVNPFINWFNYSCNQLRRFSKIRRRIETFGPDIVVTCPNGPACVFMHHKLFKNSSVRVLPYFMDDWMYQLKLKWIGGNIQDSVHKLLVSSNSWMMISRNLSEILQDRYKSQPMKVLEVHNPVNLSNAAITNPVETKDAYSLAYAGALWPMHFDALRLVAESVQLLQEKRRVQLIVYTSLDFWKWRKNELEVFGVCYGGNIPYDQIHEKLAGSDALILVSSFMKEWYSHSKGSVQTKITDYLKSKRLIISCGPEYSANHDFLKTHQCGICIETTDVLQIAKQLGGILDNLPGFQPMIDRGSTVLQNEFSFDKVHGKVKQFFKDQVYI
jgi:glycosyltransferase involved in cell wall biosynthesis